MSSPLQAQFVKRQTYHSKMFSSILDILTEIEQLSSCLMDNERYMAELAVLSHRIPNNAFRFFNMGAISLGAPYLRIGAITNGGSLYTLHIDLSLFPESIPPVYVTKMLKTKSGDEMSLPSSSMHTLTSEHGWTRICHYGYSEWTPAVSLYKVYIRCRLWLEMYEAHLITGKPIDYYLKHAS